MTQEEKARRYDEAIEKGKQIQNTPYTAHWDIMKDVAEYLLPELKESDDEKVRKTLIELVQGIYMGFCTEEAGKERDMFLTWLGKQGKQKLARMSKSLILVMAAKGNVGASWLIFPLTNEDIEYTRTDAFIKKALKWYCLDCICNDTCSNTCYFKSTFKRYLEGDDNQLPPKFENAINPDGSTSENYRYRHFIKRMQDDFIEKAKKWFEKQPELYDANGVRVYGEEDFEDFRKYMEGE